MQSRTDSPFTEEIQISVEQMFEAGNLPIHTGMAYNALSLPARNRHLFEFMQHHMYVFLLHYMITYIDMSILTARDSMTATKRGIQLFPFWNMVLANIQRPGRYSYCLPPLIPWPMIMSMDLGCARRYGLWRRDGSTDSQRYGLLLVLNQDVLPSTRYSISPMATNLDRRIRTTLTMFPSESRLMIPRKYILSCGLFKWLTIYFHQDLTWGRIP